VTGAKAANKAAICSSFFIVAITLENAKSSLGNMVADSAKLNYTNFFYHLIKPICSYSVS